MKMLAQSSVLLIHPYIQYQEYIVEIENFPSSQINVISQLWIRTSVAPEVPAPVGRKIR